jgi:hypothetical protein
MRQKGQHLNPIEQQLIVQAYRERTLLKLIGAEHNCAESSVRRVVRRAGLPPRRRSSKSAVSSTPSMG